MNDVPSPVRIMSRSPAEREEIARDRFAKLAELLKMSGCAVTPDAKSLAVNFHTGEHLMIVQVDRLDPRRIELAMLLAKEDGDIAKARWACFEATAKQFASKATVDERGSGFIVKFSVGVYAEMLNAFGDSLKAYADDVVKLYKDWLDLMMSA